jgi:hypothetical protein
MRRNKSVKTIGAGAAGAAALILFISGVYRLPPSRVYLGDAAAYVNLWPQDGDPLAASLRASQRECHLQYRDHLAPDSFDRCTTPGKGGKFIYLVGNSHAQHLVPMLERVSRERGYGYSALTISNCRLISAFQVVESIDFRFDLCKEYFDYSVREIGKRAKTGDLVLFGARSFLEKPSASDEDKPSGVYDENRRLSARKAYEKSAADIAAFAKVMGARGVSLVFTGPTPEFGLPATQCVPEWFRSSKSGCEVALGPLLQQKKAYADFITATTAGSGEGSLWDPLPVLCGAESCVPFKDGRLLFRDQHHLTVRGSEMLAGDFIKFIDGLEYSVASGRGRPAPAGGR